MKELHMRKVARDRQNMIAFRNGVIVILQK